MIDSASEVFRSYLMIICKSKSHLRYATEKC